MFVSNSVWRLPGMSQRMSPVSGRGVFGAARLMEAKQIRQLLYWCAYMVVVPIGFITALWVVAWLVNSPNQSFGEIFGTGDLLTLGALLLLSVSADIRVEDETEARVWLAVHEVLFVTLAIGAITIYGPLRTRALELLRSEDASGQRMLEASAMFSWLYVGYAVAHTVPVKAILLRLNSRRTHCGQRAADSRA